MMRSSSLRRSAQEDSYKIYLVEFKSSNQIQQKGRVSMRPKATTPLGWRPMEPVRCGTPRCGHYVACA
jgi:hypothetical protein